MAKKNKKTFFYYLLITIFWIVKFLFKLIFNIFKYGFLGIKLLFRKNNIATEKTVSKGKIKHNAVYSEFSKIKDINGDFKKFEDKLKNKSMIGIILGARGTGKSAIGMKLLENIVAKTGKKAYAMGFNSNNLPNWINSIKTVDEIGNDSVVLIDETGISFGSRDSMSNANKLLSELLFIARHKDASILFISQNSSNIEINAIRQADFLILKPSSLLQKDFERKKIKEIYSEVQKDFDELKEKKGLTYIYSDSYCGFVSNELPSFWNEKISKSFR